MEQLIQMLAQLEEEKRAKKLMQFMKQEELQVGNKIRYFGRTFAINFLNDNVRFVKVDEETAFQYIKENFDSIYVQEDGSVLNVPSIDKCPSCSEYRVLDALSRSDNKTKICGLCSTLEALGQLANHLQEVTVTRDRLVDVAEYVARLQERYEESKKNQESEGERKRMLGKVQVARHILSKLGLMAIIDQMIKEMENK